MNPFRVICVNDSNRPDGIPTTKWVKKGVGYTVIEVSKMRVQGGILGFKLAEINIDDCFPYQFFVAARFMPASLQIAEETDAMLARLLEEAKKETVQEPQPA